MAMLPCKRLVIATLVMFFFVSTTARARILQEAGDVAKKSNDDQLKPNQERELIDSDELVFMDYSPAGKNPPIHN
ncbi:Root meristem growth factor [Parasponia andersonii]|uniref:Root meristem growth factor n=1 Tax=Parasponia andersonii TaxID=3476 RepID=A0A2P5BG86_PARAD|nr:Root meristem growth factor [Parasponia andersonii]